MTTQDTDIKARLIETLGEEMANVVTHSIAAGMSILALVVLVAAAVVNGDVYRLVGVSIYGVSLILLYLASTIFHAAHLPNINAALRHRLRIADHIGIFLLIAGTYTPILLGPLRGRLGWSFLVFIWAFALLGSISKLFFTGRFHFVATFAYVAMGWSAVFIVGVLFEKMGTQGAMWIVGGGLVYTLGVIPYLWNKLPYNHAIWHLFVIGGSICHFFGI
ncbi:MAG TPA: hemolysin III family protein, partial [Anaerolineae bacterium]|nr:hemolysin III family protein [Anaerolineae bacterium]